MRTIWYMGAKTRLTDAIAAAVDEVGPRGGAVLDLMSGTAVVSRALAASRRVVANDVQAYAARIAEAYLVHPRGPVAMQGLDLAADLGARFRENHDALLAHLEPAVALEDAFLSAYGLEPRAGAAPAGLLGGGEPGADARRWASRQVPRDPAERARAYRSFALGGTPAFLEERDPSARGPFRAAAALYRRETIARRRQDPSAFPYLLASSYYPNVYLGLRQAIAVDSLRYAIDGLSGPAAARRTHYLAALLHAASVTTSATSHFCQPRGLVRDPEVKAVLTRRSFCLVERTQAFSQEIARAVRSAPLHPGNEVRQHDWRTLYADPEALRDVEVVYADPPYTADNYSRFYHVLEVLTRYDYPELQVSRGHTTKGRYPTRAHRHQSPFCHRRRVEGELADLAAETARRGAALVLSYGEENGLLLRTYRDAGLSPRAALRRFADLLRAAYGRVELRKQRLLHSGQGDSNHEVTELLLVAAEPRAGGGRRCG